MGSGVGSPDADVVQPSVVADGDGAGVVDAVAADPLVDRGDADGDGFRGGVGRFGVDRQRNRQRVLPPTQSGMCLNVG